MMAIKCVISFVMIMCVTSQRILANPSVPESGSKQPSPVMVEGNALVSPGEGTADSQLSGKSKDIERPGLPGHRTLSSAASATALHDIQAAVRSEIQTFMPMFIESAIKSLVPKIQLTVNEAVSGAMSSLVQSAINSAVKSISVDPASSTPSQSACPPSCRPTWASFMVGALGQINNNTHSMCQVTRGFPECGSTSLTPTCTGTANCCPLHCYSEIKACWDGTTTKNICIPQSFGIGKLLGGFTQAFMGGMI